MATIEKIGVESRRATVPWKVHCISPNRGMIEELAPVVSRALPGAIVTERRGYPEGDELTALLSSAPDFCFVDGVSDRDRGMELMERLAGQGGPTVIALLADNDPAMILGCLRHGAADFLLRPFTIDQIDAAFAKLARNQPKDRQVPRELGKVYCVMPAKGACGASTIGCNMAFRWRREGVGHNKVLLADMDPLTGTQSFLLKAKSSYSFLDVLNRAETLDSDLWKAMVTNRQGVDVLLAPELLIEGAGEIKDATPIVDYARRNYDVVVLDAGGAYGDWNLSMARLCDELLLVTTNELPALQAAQRALSYLDAHRIGRWKIKLVVNRYDKDVGITREVIGAALQTEVFHVIPSDYESVQKALIEGKPIPPASTLGRQINILGDKIAGKEEPVQNASPIGKIFSLFSRKS